MSHYKDRASAQYLTYKHASFYGCTIEEMGIILAVYAVIEVPFILIISVFLSPYLGGFIGSCLLLFLILSTLTFFVFMKKTANYIGKIRKNKAAGYLKLKTRQILHEQFSVVIPYVIRNGKWSTRRRI